MQDADFGGGWGKESWDFLAHFLATSCESIIISKQKVKNKYLDSLASQMNTIARVCHRDIVSCPRKLVQMVTDTV